jgi:hypothetical protein
MLPSGMMKQGGMKKVYIRDGEKANELSHRT